ncbi:MAG: AAA family ATPase [Cyanobacteria bacterium SZAS-4]|nr:AAA family ATPase [Cyanobacteria bacterium SZAS-4]
MADKKKVEKFQPTVSGEYESAEKFKRDFAFGVVVLGTEAGCGKTIFMTGLAASLRDEGFPTRAIKPFVLGSRRDAEAELAFISSITHSPVTYPVVIIDKPNAIQDSSWQQAVMLTTTRQHLTFVEMPGSPATPLAYEGAGPSGFSGSWKDSASFACDLGLPCILIAKHNKDALEKIVLAASYLKSRDAKLVGIGTVETNEFGSQNELKMNKSELELAIKNNTGSHYIGAIEYSPSISVPRVNQGNLIKVTSAGVDLLHVLRSLGAPASLSTG